MKDQEEKRFMKRRVDKANQKRSLDSYRSHKRRKKSAGTVFLSVVAILSAVVLLLMGGGWMYVRFGLLGGLTRTDVDHDNVGLTSEAMELYKDYTNIAVFGLDTREKDDEGRSDAIMIISIDRVHDKIKLISVARDSYVTIENKGKTFKDKITHAWAYGKHELALKTVNQNFNLDITDFVSMNFYQFADVIDYIGGVDIDVSRSEMNVMNTYYIPYLNSYGIKCDYIRKTGMQHLSGGQALAYARNRYTGTDIDRGSRQREVMMAMYDAVKELSVSKYPTLIKKVMGSCATSLSDGEMMSLATWAATSKPQFEQLGLPTELHCETINGTSYVVYDLDDAAKQIQEFLHETGRYAPVSSEETGSSRKPD